jgi:hypothetical protein
VYPTVDAPLCKGNGASSETPVVSRHQRIPGKADIHSSIEKILVQKLRKAKKGAECEGRKAAFKLALAVFIVRKLSRPRPQADFQIGACISFQF